MNALNVKEEMLLIGCAFAVEAKATEAYRGFSIQHESKKVLSISTPRKYASSCGIVTV